MNANPQPQKTLAKSREILSGCRSLVVGYCETQTDTFIAEATQQLFEQAGQLKENKEQQRLFEARSYLENNAGRLPKTLEKAVKQQFRQVFDQTQSNTAKATATHPDGELALVNSHDQEIEIAITSMALRLESNCAEELFGLTQRMAMLNKGVKANEAEVPYGPRFLSQTFFAFLAEANLDLPLQLLILKLFERCFIAPLSELYKELNQYLISANVLPNLRYTKGKTANQPPRRRKSDQLLAASEERQTELYQALESVLNAAPRPINAAAPMMPVEQVLHELLMQQSPATDLLNQASNQAFPDTNTLSLQQSLECVALLFEIINSQNSLGSPVKNLLSHLRSPYARVALTDPAFLANPQHDARQLFHAIVQASEQWTDEETDPANEVIQRIKAIVERVINDASGSETLDASMFGELLEEFNEFIEAFEKKIKLTEQRSVQAAEGREKLKENQLRVTEILNQKIGDDTLPKPIEHLIRDTWSSYMTYILLRHGENNKQWEAAIAAIDSVLWYIEPKTTDAEQQQAADIKDTLYQTLTQGMTTVGLDSSDIKSKLRSLELCSKLATENLQSAEPGPRSAASIDAQPTEQATSDTRQTCASDIDLPPTDKTEPQSADNTDRPRKSRIEQQQEALSQTTRNTTPEASPARKAATENRRTDRRRASDFDLQRVLSMEFGTWLDWRAPDENPRQVKLTWYNTRTQNCMLSNRAGKEIGMVGANTIALGMVDGWIKVIDKPGRKPLFERMLEAVTRKRGHTTTNTTQRAEAR